MPQVRLTTSRAGTGWTQEAGQIVEVGADEAERLIASHQAVPVRQSAPVQTEQATAAPAEEAAVDQPEKPKRTRKPKPTDQ
jgi:hypothetical protein